MRLRERLKELREKLFKKEKKAEEKEILKVTTLHFRATLHILAGGGGRSEIFREFFTCFPSFAEIIAGLLCFADIGKSSNEKEAVKAVDQFYFFTLPLYFAANGWNIANEEEALKEFERLLRLPLKKLEKMTQNRAYHLYGQWGESLMELFQKLKKELNLSFRTSSIAYSAFLAITDPKALRVRVEVSAQ